jgi:hypothetical protein
MLVLVSVMMRAGCLHMYPRSCKAVSPTGRTMLFSRHSLARVLHPSPAALPPAGTAHVAHSRACSAGLAPAPRSTSAGGSFARVHAGPAPAPRNAAARLSAAGGAAGGRGRRRRAGGRAVEGAVRGRAARRHGARHAHARPLLARARRAAVDGREPCAPGTAPARPARPRRCGCVWPAASQCRHCSSASGVQAHAAAQARPRRWGCARLRCRMRLNA